MSRRRRERFAGFPPGSLPRSFSRLTPNLGSEPFLRQHKIQEPVPVGGDPLGHRFFFGAVLARHLGGLTVARALSQPLQQLVGGYLQVLRNERVPRVPYRLVCAPQIGYPFRLRGGDRREILAHGDQPQPA